MKIATKALLIKNKYKSGSETNGHKFIDKDEEYYWLFKNIYFSDEAN